MNPHETYTAVMRHFWQCQREHSFQPSDVAVYAYLVDTCFTLEWKNPFKHANGYLCGALAITEKTLISARNRLQQAGLVGFQSGKHRRDLSTYSLPILDQLADKAVNIPPYRAETLQPNGQEVSSLSGVNAPDNGREITSSRKRKTLSPPNPPPAPTVTTSAGEPEPADDFSQFWQTYGKKEDKLKCQQRWAALSPAERTAALAALPGYVASTPEKRYRKNPLTWLNGKCWLDEDTPADRATAPTPKLDSAPLSIDTATLFGHTQTVAEGLARARQDPDYQRYLAEQAAHPQTEVAPALAA